MKFLRWLAVFTTWNSGRTLCTKLQKFWIFVQWLVWKNIKFYREVFQIGILKNPKLFLLRCFCNSKRTEIKASIEKHIKLQGIISTPTRVSSAWGFCDFYVSWKTILKVGSHGVYQELKILVLRFFRIYQCGNREKVKLEPTTRCICCTNFSLSNSSDKIWARGYKL